MDSPVFQFLKVPFQGNLFRFDEKKTEHFCTLGFVQADRIFVKKNYI